MPEAPEQIDKKISSSPRISRPSYKPVVLFVIGLIMAIGALFLLLATFRLLPRSENILSRWGTKSKVTAGVTAGIGMGLCLYTLCWRRALLSKAHNPPSNDPKQKEVPRPRDSTPADPAEEQQKAAEKAAAFEAQERTRKLEAIAIKLQSQFRGKRVRDVVRPKIEKIRAEKAAANLAAQERARKLPSIALKIQSQFRGKKARALVRPEIAKIRAETLEVAALAQNARLLDQRAAYGNKYYGLAQLQEFVQRDHNLNLKVPSFLGIASSQMIAFIQKGAPQIVDGWNELGRVYEASSIEERATFVTLPHVKAALEKMQQEIITLFAECAKNPRKRHLLPLSDSQIQEWIQERERKGHYLMVRSSGVEDSKESANAGGNLSVPYVKPNFMAISEAASRVVASYFGEKSVTNLINTTQKPFEGLPKLSFILQELVGEIPGEITAPHAIPVSAVLYTKESTFSTPENPVTTISLAYGHGEAVVDSTKHITGDRCYIVRSNCAPNSIVISYQTGIKSTRLVPTGRAQLEERDNPPQLVTQRAIDQKMAQDLFSLGRQVEDFFGEPMDMELVIKEGTIYLVQARQVTPRPEATPAYVTFNEENQELFSAPPIETKKILFGKAAVIELDLLDEEVYLCENLHQATLNPRKESYKVILSKEDEGVNSHPWTTFSGLGMVCLYHPKADDILSELKKRKAAGDTLHLCTQSGIIYSLKQGVDAGQVIQEGYFTHPADISLSIAEIEQNDGCSLPPEIEKAVMLLKQATVEEVATRALQMISESALVQSAGSTLQKIRAKKLSPHHPLAAAIARLEEEREAIFAEIQAAFKEGKDSFERLYHIKRLESILGQKYSAHGSFSYVQLPSAVKKMEEEEAYQSQLPVQAQFGRLLDLAKMAPFPKIGEDWKNFLLALELAAANKAWLPGEEGKVDRDEEVAAEKILQFKEMMHHLKATTMMPLWLLTIFAPAWQTARKKSALSCLKPLLADYETINKKQLATLQKLSTTIERMPKTGADAAELIKIMQECESLAFLRSVNSANSIEKMVAFDIMKKAIELVDLSIKGIQANPDGDHEAKLKAMRKLLDSNKALLRTWFTKLFKEEELQPGVDWTVDRYLSELIDGPFAATLEDYSPEQLLPSPHFSVRAATLGSQAEFDRNRPRTTADLHSLIHQDELYALSVLQKKMFSIENLTKLTSIPGDFRLLAEEVPRMCSTQTNYMGLEFRERALWIDFNLPMRNHSATVGIAMDPDKPDHFLWKTHLFAGGGRRGDASSCFNRIMTFLKIFNQPELLELTAPPQLFQQELSFTWNVPYERDLTVRLVTEVIHILLYNEHLEGIGNALQKFDQDIDNNSHKTLRLISENYLALLLTDPKIEDDQNMPYVLKEFVLKEIDPEQLFLKHNLSADWRHATKCMKNILHNFTNARYHVDGNDPYVILVSHFAKQLLAHNETRNFLRLFSKQPELFIATDEFFEEKNKEMLNQLLTKVLDKSFYHIFNYINYHMREWNGDLSGLAARAEYSLKNSKAILQKLSEKGLLDPAVINSGKVHQGIDQMLQKLAEKGHVVQLDREKIFQPILALLRDP